MALSSTVYNFDIDLSDSDRGVYETLSLRLARHPSESEDYLVARVLAYCLEYAEGIAFSKGLCAPDEPAILVRDLTGRLQAWIEIGAPDAARLHKASKHSPRVAVYVHKDPTQWLRALQRERIHRADALEIYVLNRGLVAALVARLDRRMAFGLSVHEGEVLVAFDDQTVSGSVRRCVLDD
ncbi:MAG: hypothetical protein DMF84_21040 [Acidobacteria bacterium]|nr:MAG: hypothetical protein DMF84_21040 [Acidobacteriota bacterium]